LYDTSNQIGFLQTITEINTYMKRREWKEVEKEEE